MITIKIQLKDKVVELELSEARQLYQELNLIFKSNIFDTTPINPNVFGPVIKPYKIGDIV